MPDFDDDDLPIATPISPPPPPPKAEPVKPIRTATPVDAKPKRELPKLPRDVDAKPPRASGFLACSVLGCLGVLILAAIGFIAFAAIMLIGHLGNEIADRGNEPPGQSKTAHIEFAGPILPTKMAEDSKIITLPGQVTAVARGANGRYLMMQVKNQILVFDPNEAALLAPFQFESTDQNLLFTASATRLFVYRKNQFERYSLINRTAADATLPWQERPHALATGCDVDGPLFALATRQKLNLVVQFDPENFLERGNVRTLPGVQFGNAGPRISADGKTLAFGAEPTERWQLVLEGPQGLSSRQSPNGAPSGHLTPSPDGQLLYTSHGVFKVDGTAVYKPAKGFLYTVPPAHASDLFLSLEVNQTGSTRTGVRMHLASNPSKQIPVSGVLGPISFPANDSVSGLAADQRVHFWPAAGLIAVVSSPNAFGNHTLNLYKVDVEEVIAAIQKEYLVIGSHPPAFAVRGETWTYPLTTWSSSPAVAYKLKSSPDGMIAVTREGNTTLTWPVPTNFSGDQQNVIVEVTDGNLTAEQKFRLTIIEPNKP